MFLISHFPIDCDDETMELINSGELKNLINRYDNVKFYLNGHTHVFLSKVDLETQYITCGSSTACELKKSNLNCIHYIIENNTITITPYFYDEYDKRAFVADESQKSIVEINLKEKS